MIAHSTALESITVEVDSMSIGAGGVGNTTPNAGGGCCNSGMGLPSGYSTVGNYGVGTSANTSHNIPQVEDYPGEDATDSGRNFIMINVFLMAM